MLQASTPGLAEPAIDWQVGAAVALLALAQSAREDGQIIAAMTLLVKTRGDSARLAQDIRSLAEQQDPNAPVGQVLPLEEIASSSIADFRSTVRVFLSFAGPRFYWPRLASTAWSRTGSPSGRSRAARIDPVKSLRVD